LRYGTTETYKKPFKRPEVLEASVGLRMSEKAKGRSEKLQLIGKP
jgi:hypothetical protein